MTMYQGLMLMHVRVRFLALPRKCMLMLVMKIMSMRMLMFEKLMSVFMIMMFGEVQPYAASH